MPPPLKISKYVFDRLLNTKENCCGNLYGTFYDKNLLVLGLCLKNENSADYLHSFPTEIDLCGMFELNNAKTEFDAIARTIDEIYVTDCPLYLQKCNGEKLQTYFYVNDKFELSDYEVISGSQIYSMFAHIRLKTQVPLSCELNLDAIEEGFAQLRKHITSGKIAFNFVDTNIYVLGTINEKGYTGISGEPTLGDILKLDTGDFNLKRSKSSMDQIDVVYVKMLKKTTMDSSSESNERHAPVVHVDKKLSQNLNILLELDTLSIVYKDTKLNNLYDILVESAIRCLWLLKKPLLEQFSKSIGDHSEINQPEIFHFYPSGCGHFVSRVFDKNCNEVHLETDRKRLHKVFLLPSNQPLFRKSNQYKFAECNKPQTQLVNPHLELSIHGYGGTVALVRGKYKYYHYCQDGMDDNGWGCAYRSLQTLASWFLLQGYTDKPVPTIRDIQKCLVDIGDKSSSFIDSRQWIGSTEVNFVLNSYLQITSKIIYVSSGEELATKGQELLNHFKLNGCPVMIGGGVLAHTILGVDYNTDTGKIMFLILDPHFTGSDDIKVIVKKGWCGWKGIDFWDKKSYYNMCLPQVPICI